jgi:hypothetical protein
VTFQIGEWPVWLGALLIFFSRVTDVTLGTLRIAFISRGEKALAPLIAFFEMMVWLFAISTLMQNLTNFAYYVAYAGGFAGGVFTGLRIEDRIALGSRMIRTITQDDASELSDELRAAGWGVTSRRDARSPRARGPRPRGRALWGNNLAPAARRRGYARSGRIGYLPGKAGFDFAQPAGATVA